MMQFALHPRLAADTTFITDWPLSRVLLMNDARFVWLILVPRRDASELHELPPEDRAILIEETSRAGAVLKATTACTKINIGALGNVVPQLHIHVVARQAGDAAWPGPVWGSGSPASYEAGALESLLSELRPRLA